MSTVSVTPTKRFEELRTLVIPLSPGQGPWNFEILLPQMRPHFVIFECGNYGRLPSAPYDFYQLARQAKAQGAILLNIPIGRIPHEQPYRAPCMGGNAIEQYRSMYLDRATTGQLGEVLQLIEKTYKASRGDLRRCWDAIEQRFCSQPTSKTIEEERHEAAVRAEAYHKPHLRVRGGAS